MHLTLNKAQLGAPHSQVSMNQIGTCPLPRRDDASLHKHAIPPSIPLVASSACEHQRHEQGIENIQPISVLPSTICYTTAFLATPSADFRASTKLPLRCVPRKFQTNSGHQYLAPIEAVNYFEAVRPVKRFLLQHTSHENGIQTPPPISSL